MEIDEMIADAKAEEQVTQNAAKAEDREKDFRDTLRNRLKEALTPKDDEKVTIRLDEYTVLTHKAMDLDRLLNAIVSCMELNYNKSGLRVYYDNRIIETFRALYPEVYESIYELELEKDKREQEKGDD